MPDPRLLRALRYGQYDEPPASVHSSSTPRSRRNRLQQALRATADMSNDLTEMGASTHPSRRALIAPPQRQRPRPLFNRQEWQTEEIERRRRADEMEGRARVKRRRLDYEPSPTPQPPIKYGHYGQVVPGRLRLSIISCDGGEHRDPRHPSTYLGPQNLLRHDKSVYCSERPSSGILLQHADDSPFCLEKLHIIGPEHGFSAPVREGIVYVAMTLRDLQKYMDPPQHARIHGVHTPPYRRRWSFRDSPDRLSHRDTLRDHEVSGRQREADQPLPRPFGMLGDSYRLNGSSSAEEGQCDGSPLAEADEVLVSAESGTLPVTLLSDEETGPEDNTSQEVFDYRLQRLHSMRRRLEMDTYEREREFEEHWSSVNTTRLDESRDRYDTRVQQLHDMYAGERLHDLARPSESRDYPHDLYTYQDDSPAYRSKHRRPEDAEHYDDGMLDAKVTRARFHIGEEKYKVAIKFDPPVSGRFILIKLWANRSNVDVQSVIAKGFGGQRFFPAVEFR